MKNNKTQIIKKTQKSAIAKSSPLDGKSVLVTGGTGSFGRKFIEAALRMNIKKLIVLSRDELKQSVMQAEIHDPRMRYFLGDVRDEDRLELAFRGVDIVVHAAALKQVPALEYNPLEAIKTNILGTQNVLSAARKNNVEKVLFVSSDKAVNPINLYGSTKLCAEKLCVAANAYSREDGRPRISIVRYGNVIGSRGSIIDVLKKQRETGTVMLTHAAMTRFWLKLEDAVQLVLYGLTTMRGGEIFIPKVPSMKVIDLLKTLAPDCAIKTIGIRPGEKLHEMLLTEDEVRRAKDLHYCYVVEPNHEWWDKNTFASHAKLDPDFVYASDVNTLWLTDKELKALATV